MITLTWPQVMAFRMERHFLEARAGRADLLRVARRTCGLHAQVMSSAELAAQARIDGLEKRDVGAALWADRTLFKTWAMRWTLHLFPAADFPMYVSAFRGLGSQRTVEWLNAQGISLDDLDALSEGFRASLNGGGLTREQLAEAVVRHSGRPHLRDMLMGNWGTWLKPGAYQGLLIFGPSRGQNVTFVSPRHWLGEYPEIDPDEAQLEAVRRYLTAYGPATPADLANWWGTGKVHARRLFKALGDELAPVAVDGWEGWALAADADPLQSMQPGKTVRLLPGFDPYTLGLRRETEPALSPGHKGRVFRQQGWISAVVLVGGKVVGVWKHEVKRARLAITVEPFEGLSRAVRAGVEREAARLGAYLDAEPEVSFAD